jgi:hypothetical protein
VAAVDAVRGDGAAVGGGGVVTAQLAPEEPGGGGGGATTDGGGADTTELGGALGTGADTGAGRDTTERGGSLGNAGSGGAVTRGCAGDEGVSGLFRERRLTTVGRIRSSTTAGLFCFSRWRFRRSICSGAMALMWFLASVTPTDCSSATSALLSIPRSRATS